jgi:hypothetical protein
MSPNQVITAFAACLVFSCSSGPGTAIPNTRSEKQMLGLIEKFDRWDHDGNGLLSSREIDAGLATLKGTSRAVTFDAADVVKHYDQNGDKSVSLREAQSGYQRTTEDGADSLQ